MADTKTKQEIRDKAVEQAKKDITWAEERLGRIRANGEIALRIEYVVNRKKRTVVSLIYGIDGEVISRGIAKCSVLDCFNEYLGKAVALSKALVGDGNTYNVPNVYQNVPNPQGFRVGDIVKGFTGIEYEIIEGDQKNDYTIPLETVIRNSEGFEVVDDTTRYKDTNNIRFKYVFSPDHVDAFEYCPRCGSEIIEVYPGDFDGHTTCMNEECEGLSFEIRREE